MYEVFLRINSGSVQLSPQELRQALNPGQFTKALNEFTISSDSVKGILKLKEPDFRMRDNELVLRYLSTRRGIEWYNGNLKQFLDESTRQFNKEWDSEESNVVRYLEDLDQSIAVSVKVFEDFVFKKWNGAAFESRINRAVFDVVSYFFSFPHIARRSIELREQVVQAFRDLCDEDAEFLLSVTSTTKSVEAVRIRFDRWRAKLSDTIGESIPLIQWRYPLKIMPPLAPKLWLLVLTSPLPASAPDNARYRTSAP